MSTVLQRLAARRQAMATAVGQRNGQYWFTGLDPGSAGVGLLLPAVQSASLPQAGRSGVYPPDSFHAGGVSPLKCAGDEKLECWIEEPNAPGPSVAICDCVKTVIVVAGKLSPSGTPIGDTVTCPTGFTRSCDEGPAGHFVCGCVKDTGDGLVFATPIITESSNATALTSRSGNPHMQSAREGARRQRRRGSQPGLLQHMFGSGRLRLGAKLRRRMRPPLPPPPCPPGYLPTTTGCIKLPDSIHPSAGGSPDARRARLAALLPQQRRGKPCGTPFECMDQCLVVRPCTAKPDQDCTVLDADCYNNCEPCEASDPFGLRAGEEGRSS